MDLCRKEKHLFSVAPCKNNKEGKCPFSSFRCWWNHEEIQNLPDNIKCFVCNESFENKTEMMAHRKKEHSSLIRKCLQFKENNCRFEEKSCWFMHDDVKEEDIPEEVEKESENVSDSYFRMASANPKPPIRKENVKQMS